MKFNNIIIAILFLQILCFTQALNLSKVSRKRVKEMNFFMKKIKYGLTRYIEFLKAQKENYKWTLNNRRDINRRSLMEDYNLIKEAIAKIEKWYQTQWDFYDKLTSKNSRISIIRDDFDNFWANIESALDYYLEPLDYIERIKIGTMKIKKCLSNFNGRDCSEYNEVEDVLKPHELERYHKKDKSEKSFFSGWFGSKK